MYIKINQNSKVLIIFDLFRKNITLVTWFGKIVFFFIYYIFSKNIFFYRNTTFIECDEVIAPLCERLVVVHAEPKI